MIKGWAWLAALTGFLLILFLPVSLSVRGLLAGAWLVSSAIDRRWLFGGKPGVRDLRLHGGQDWRALFDNGIWRGVEPLPGCWLGNRLGWMRLADDTGQTHALLLRRAAGKAQDWRRLQVILRLGRS